MKNLKATTGVIAIMLAIFISLSGDLLAGEIPSNSPQKGQGMASIEHASKADKYLFIFFYKENDEKTNAMKSIFDTTMNKISDRAEGVAVDIVDPAEKEIVEKFYVQQAPMPLVLVLASNGAVTGGYPVEFSEDKLMEAFLSPSTEQCLKALQARKLVLLCIQNKSTKLNNEALQGVSDFIADPLFKQTTEVVTLDPKDITELKFLTQIKVDPKTDQAITVMLAPPGRVVGQFEGATDKDKLAAALKSCSSGSSGCCSKKKK